MKSKPRRPALSSLPPRTRASLAAARALARERGVGLYLAGGVVRDLFAGAARPLGVGHPDAPMDVDLLVAGDASRLADFARSLGERLSATVRLHERFGTATLTSQEGERLDVASTRRETYAKPGDLPAVEFSATIEEDLARRDFTVNAMALELSPGRRLIDPHGGLSDLSRGILRVLHADSFRDDPTRALRGVRYGNRYGWRLEAATRRGLGRAIVSGAFDRVSGDRVRRELVKIFAEPGRAAAIRRLRALGLDAAIEPALGRVSDPIPRLRVAEAIAAGENTGLGWLGYLLAWIGASTAKDARRVAARLSVAGEERERLLSWPRTLRALSGLAKRRPSEAARRAAGLSRDQLVAAAASLAAPDRKALNGLRRSAFELVLSIRGADLLAAGIPAGEVIGRALARTRAARIDGAISEGDELAFAVRCARQEAERP